VIALLDMVVVHDVDGTITQHAGIGEVSNNKEG
jgi:hypothetical protein